MNKKDNGGAAFPLHPGISPEWTASAGMTLRDWFAGQALIMLVPDQSLTLEETAIGAYRLADAMLAARSANAD